MSQNRYVQPSTLHVCIDARDEFNIIGRVYCPLAEKEFEFYDFSQFLLKVDDMFNEAAYPQAFQKKRTFDMNREATRVQKEKSRPKIYWEWEQLKAQHGKIATYDILVATRIKSNWQGTIYREDGVEIGNYQDVMQIFDCIGADLDGREYSNKR